MERVLIIAVTLGVTTAFFSSAAVGQSLPIHEGFDNYPTGSLPDPPWTDISDAGVTAEVTSSVSYAGGKSLHFDDTSSGAGIKLKRSFNPVTSVMLEYYMRTDNDAYEGHFVTLEGDSTSSYGWDKSMGGLSFGNAGGGGSAGWIGLIDDGGWPEPEILQYETGKWYRVRRWIDIVADEETTHVDEMGGTGHGEYYRTGIKHDNTELNAFHIWSSSSQSSDAYLDEITLTPEPATLSLLALGGLALIRKRRKR